MSSVKKAKCPHSCKECRDLTASGGALKTHQINPRLHPNCHKRCPGYSLLKLDYVPSSQIKKNPPLTSGSHTTMSSSRSQIGMIKHASIELTPLSILFVLEPTYEPPIEPPAGWSPWLTFVEYDDSDQGDRQWLRGMEKKIKGFQNQYCIDSATKKLWTFSIFMVLYHLIGGDKGWTSTSSESSESGSSEDDSTIDRSSQQISVEVVTYAEFRRMLKVSNLFARFSAWNVVITGIGRGDEFFESRPKEEIMVMWQKMRALEQHVMLWPSFNESYRYDEKMMVEYDLDYIASTVTHTPRPKREEYVPNTHYDGDWFFKRQFSSNSEHTFKMTSNTPPKTHPIADWFLQEYNPLIQKSGEMRLIVAGGDIVLSYIGVCKSYPDTSSYYKGLPTKTLQRMEQRLAAGRTPHLIPDSDSSVEETARAEQELKKFVLDTWRTMVKLEEQRQSAPVSIQDIARFDVSLVRKGNRLHYYVNEITRLPYCGLFLFEESSLAGGSTASTIARHLRSSLNKGMDYVKRAYPGRPTPINSSV